MNPTRHALALLFTALALVACDDAADDGTPDDDLLDVADTAMDTAPGDLGTDAPSDAPADLEPDTRPDSTPDTALDTMPDTAADTAPDTAPDVEPDMPVAQCGNGVVEPGEFCDGNCPTACDDGDVCTADVLTGSPTTCDVLCVPLERSCVSGDGCCPTDCGPLGSFIEDADCGSPRALGEPCSDYEWCADGFCVSEADFDWPDGYCSPICDQSTPCPTGSHCGNKLETCLLDCTSDADCRAPHYTCHDSDGDGATECAPRPDGPGAIGAPCEAMSDCAGGDDARCLDTETELYQGYCTQQCYDRPCPTGSHCGYGDWVIGEMCVADCTTDADCRGPGYRCFDGDGDGTTECMGGAFGDTPLGGPCTSTLDCGTGPNGTCATEAEGYRDGYCLVAGCATGLACDAASHCVTELLRDEFGLCMLDCTSDADCRADGYRCIDLDDDGATECAPAGTGSQPVGAACAGVWDCTGGKFALCIAAPQGSCSLSCAPGEATCPAEAVCVDFLEFCRKNCTTNLDCAPGHYCTFNECLPI